MARFFRRGKSRIFFVPAIADRQAPSAAEINAGTELTNSIAEMAGFTFGNDPIEVPDMGSVFTKTIPGSDTAEDSSLTLYEDDTTNPLRATLAKDTAGFIVLFPAGTAGTSPAAGDKVEVWSIKVTSTAREWSTGNDPARYVVGFSMSETPAIDRTLAA